MLSNDLLKAKTMDDLLTDARMQIPLYSKEWTNFNPSDPAVTVLESMSYVAGIQQSFIDRMPASVQEKMYELAGCKRLGSRCARVLLQADYEGPGMTIPSGQKFSVGNMIFETNRENHITSNKIIGIYSVNDRNVTDYSYVLDPDMPLKAAVFGTKPQSQMEFYIICNGMAEPGEDLIFYLTLEELFKRNEIEDSQPFAELQWQLFTKKGFVDIRTKDYTEGMIRSGELRFKLPSNAAAEYTELPQKGYCIRAVLKKANYDIPPRLIGISGFLFEVWQRNTQSICYTFPYSNSIEVYSDILEAGYWMMFCREDDGHYHKYSHLADENLRGRYYRVNRLGFGNFEISFDKEKYGYGPGNYVNAVKLVAYNEEIMSQYRLGTVYGYENQRFNIPADNIITESFSLVAETEGADGEKIYSFIKPGSEEEFDLNYVIVEEDNQIKILDAGDYIGATIYMCACATTAGSSGNIRAGAGFVPVGYDSPVSFSNPAPGAGGRYKDQLADIKRNFIKSINEHFTAVEAGDYERIVKSTPGLCIHKVKAVMDNSKNEVQIAVKPYGVEERTVMSPVYRELITKRLESRRLLATKIQLVQPVYVEVICSGTIFVKPHFEGSREAVERTIREHLDYINSDRNFGDLLSFDELFHKIEALDCVELIYNLSCTSQNGVLAPKLGLDIQPKNNVLLVPGEIRIELNTLE